jgi:putative transcriptional regulator
MFSLSFTPIAVPHATSFRPGSPAERNADHGARSPDMENIRRMKLRINHAKIDATTEADIRRHMREDDQEETNLAGFAPVIPPQMLRKQLGMTQDEFAKALRIPLSTLRNWEQGRVLPDPAARSLLTIVAKNPKAALKALAA